MNVESMQNFNVGTSVSGKCLSHKERCANNSEAPSGLSGKRHVYTPCLATVWQTLRKSNHGDVLVAIIESKSTL